MTPGNWNEMGEALLPQCISSPLPRRQESSANTICYCNVACTYISLCGKATHSKQTTDHFFGDIENTLTKILNWLVITMEYGKTTLQERWWPNIFSSENHLPNIDIYIYSSTDDKNVLSKHLSNTKDILILQYQLSSCCRRYCGRWKNNWIRSEQIDPHFCK